MIKYAKLATLMAALPSVAIAQENAGQCPPIPEKAVITNFNLLPGAILASLTKFRNFSPTPEACKGETSFQGHNCFERAAFLHNEWIVIVHDVGHPDGKGHAFVWKSDGHTEISWTNSYASLCTLEKLGAVADGGVVSKDEGKPAYIVLR